MALNGAGIIHTFKAGEDLSGKQYHAVYISAAGTVSAVDGGTRAPIGILQNAPTSGQDASVMIMGVSKFVAGAAVTRGAYLYSDNGKAKVATLGTTTNKVCIGICIVAAAADTVTATAAINCATPIHSGADALA